jgi:hypothetical protein
MVTHRNSSIRMYRHGAGDGFSVFSGFAGLRSGRRRPRLRRGTSPTDSGWILRPRSDTLLVSWHTKSPNSCWNMQARFWNAPRRSAWPYLSACPFEKSKSTSTGWMRREVRFATRRTEGPRSSIESGGPPECPGRSAARRGRDTVSIATDAKPHSDHRIGTNNP